MEVKMKDCGQYRLKAAKAAPLRYHRRDLSEEKKWAGLVWRGRSRVFSPSHSVGLAWVVFQRKLAQTVAFNWLLQTQNVYSALRRPSWPLLGRRPRPVQQIADVQGREVACRAQVCSWCGAESGKKNRGWKEELASRGNSRCSQRSFARVRCVEYKAALSLPPRTHSACFWQISQEEPGPAVAKQAAAPNTLFKPSKQTPRQNSRLPSEWICLFWSLENEVKKKMPSENLTVNV